MSSVAFDPCLSGSPFIIIAALHWAPVIFYALCYMLSMHDLIYSSQQVYEIQVIIIPVLQMKIPRIWGVENLYPRSQGNRRGRVQYLSLCVLVKWGGKSCGRICNESGEKETHNSAWECWGVVMRVLLGKLGGLEGRMLIRVDHSGLDRQTEKRTSQAGELLQRHRGLCEWTWQLWQGSRPGWGSAWLTWGGSTD